MLVAGIKKALTVFDLISEPPPLFFNLKKKKNVIFCFKYFFFRGPVIIISGPSHVTIFGSTVFHPG